MIYLSQMVGNPVFDLNGERIGKVNDLGIATGEVFPRVTALAIDGPGRTPFMVSWRKYVDSFDEDEVRLKVVATDIRFSYLQPDEVLIARDLLNKQIVDTRGARVVRVNDLKLSDTSSTQLRLLGAEVGARGILRSLAPWLETATLRVFKALGRQLPERIIAWNYMDLLDRDLSNVKLSVSHKTLDELHPADIADIIERLDPRLRGQVFAQLDDEMAAEAMAELDDDEMAARIMDGMDEADASKMLAEMDPDDAAELVSELDYDKAEKLLRLMGVQERRAIRQLLGYREGTAGRIMTSEAVALPHTATVAEAKEHLRSLDEDFETVHYLYLTDEDRRLCGVVTLRRLVLAAEDERLSSIAIEDEVVTASPDDDQEDVAKDIAKYNLLAMPVVDDNHRLLGIVTVDDALDVLEEEHAEDLQIAGAGSAGAEGAGSGGGMLWLLRRNAWFFIWAVGVAALAAVSREPLANVLPLCAALPLALVVADDSVSYATNFFIENDPDDESAPSVLGFSLKSLGVGLAFGAVVLLASTVFGNVAFMSAREGSVRDLLSSGFVGAAGAIAASFALAGPTLAVLRARDARNLDTSGFSLSLLAMAVACAVFVAIALCAAQGTLQVM